MNKAKEIFERTIEIRNEMYFDKAKNGEFTQEEQLVYDYLQKIAHEYVLLTDELYVLKPFTLFFGRGELNGI